MIEILVISLLILCVFSYIIMDKDLSSPSLLYTGGFFTCSIGAYMYRYEWGLGLHKNTCLLIILGAISFIITEFVCRMNYKQAKPIINVSAAPVINIKNYKLILFVGFQLLIYYLLVRYKFAQSVGATSIGESIGDVSQRSKIEHENLYFPWYIQYPYQMCRDAGFIWICLFSYYFHKPKRYRIKKWLIGLNLMVCIVVGGYVSGGRMPFLGYLIPLFIFLYTFKMYKQNWNSRTIPLKTVFIIAITAIIFVTSFVQVGNLMGRKESESTNSYVLSIYCGAQIKNLDDFLNNPLKTKNTHWGGYTFNTLYKDFNKNASKNYSDYDMSSLFNTYRGYPLGNVYTCYYHYYYDFKMGGLICVIVMSFLLSSLNNRIHYTNFFKTGELNLGVLLYASFISAAFLSFFSESFYSKIGCVALIKSFVFWLLIKIYLQGFKNKIITFGKKRIL